MHRIKKLSDLFFSHPWWTIFIFGFLLYAVSLRNSFIGDDIDQIAKNPLVHSMINIPLFFTGGTFFNGFSALSGIYYKPLLSSVFAILYTFGGGEAGLFRVYQILLHIANTYLLFALLKNFFSKKAAFLASLIFLTHPANAESVLYISAIQDVQFLFFGLLSLLMFIKNTTKHFVLGLIALFSSLLSKEAGILFFLPALLLIFQNNKNQFTKKFILQTISIGSIFLFYLLLRINAVGLYRYHQESFPFMQMTLSERLINIPFVLLSQITVLVFPVYLAFTQNWTIKSQTFYHFFLPIIALTLLSIALITINIQLFNKKSKLFFKTLFFSLWFITGLVLHSQLLPLDMTLAERWLYFTSISLIALITIFIEYSINKNKKIIPLLTTIVILLIVLFSLRTFLRTLDWQNEYTLYSHDITISPDSFNLQNGLANELIKKQQFDTAKIHAEKATELKPDFCHGWNNLGVIYMNKNDLENAKKNFEKAVELKNCALAFDNLATWNYFHNPDKNDAAEKIRIYASEIPSSPKVWLMLSLAEYRIGNKEKAIEALKKSNQLNPTSGTALIYQKIQKGEPIELKEK